MSTLIIQHEEHGPAHGVVGFPRLGGLSTEGLELFMQWAYVTLLQMRSLEEEFEGYGLDEVIVRVWATAEDTNIVVEGATPVSLDEVASFLRADDQPDAPFDERTDTIASGLPADDDSYDAGYPVGEDPGNVIYLTREEKPKGEK